MVYFGEFNSIRSKGERKGALSHFRNEEMKCFEKFVMEAKLIDLPMAGRKYTWYRSDGSTISQLDRFLVSESWLNTWPNCSQWGLQSG